jgi:hypothetical protein
LIFVREVSDPLTSLVKRMDEQLAEARPVPSNQRQRGVYIIFCNDDPTQTERLKGWIAGMQLKHVVVCKEGTAGPDRYRVNRDADVTAVIYERNRVRTNIALRKGELDADAAGTIECALSEVLPKK